MNQNAKINLWLDFLHNKFLFIEHIRKQLRLHLLLALLISSWVLTQAIRIHASSQAELQEGIAEKIIRFHVIANSDSNEDQNLKYLVKDVIVEYLQPYLKNAKDIEESHDIIEGLLPSIQKKANQIIADKGYGYSTEASLTFSYFPIKVYGDYTFPPGSYQALQIKIGDAKGKNWWCVMFPPLCFVDETYSIVDEDGKNKLKHLLTEDEFEVLRNNKIPIKIKFKLFDSIKKLFDKG